MEETCVAFDDDIICLGTLWTEYELKLMICSRMGNDYGKHSLLLILDLQMSNMFTFGV